MPEGQETFCSIKKMKTDIFEKASLLELAFWKMAYRNERMEENAK